MSLTVSQLISDFRWTTDDTSMPTASDALRLVNKARQEVAKKCKVFEDVLSLSSSTSTYRYALPSTATEVRMVEFNDGTNGFNRVYPMNKSEWDNVDFETTYDRHCFYFLDNRYLNFSPRVTNSAVHTHIDDIANVTAVQTTIPVDSTSEFPTVGKIIIDSEVIYYYGKTSTSFTGCVRGSEGTTAAIHLDNATVTERDITVYYYKFPTDLSATSSTLETQFEHFPNVLIYWMAWQAKIKDSDDVQSTGSMNQGNLYHSLWVEEMADFMQYLNSSADSARTINRVR